MLPSGGFCKYSTGMITTAPHTGMTRMRRIYAQRSDELASLMRRRERGEVSFDIIPQGGTALNPKSGHDNWSFCTYAAAPDTAERSEAV